MSNKPNYLVLLPGGNTLAFDMLASALEHVYVKGVVYERLGHSTAVKLDHEEAMLVALKAARKAMTNDRYLKPRIGMEVECSAVDSIVSQVESYNAEIAAAWERAESEINKPWSKSV